MSMSLYFNSNGVCHQWAETLSTQMDDADIVAKFIYENIIIQFGYSKELISNKKIHFINKTIKNLLNKYFIKHRKSTPYHPCTNEQTKKINGILCKIITKIVQGSNTNWDDRIFDALWAYWTICKVTTKHTPFQLVYGQKAILPIEFEIQSLCIALDNWLRDLNSLQQHCYKLEQLDETCTQIYLHMIAIQNRQKSFYDSKLLPKQLQTNDLVYYIIVNSKNYRANF